MTIITCPNCKGQGVEHPLDDPPCFLCNGNGMLEVKPHERVVTNAMFKDDKK